jgi:hypothetical protein
MPLTHAVDSALTVVATKESKTRYVIIETQNLIETLDGLSLPKGIKQSLTCKLESAKHKLERALEDILAGNEKHANNMLNCARNKVNAFILEVDALSGKKLSTTEADMLLDAGQTIITHIEDTIHTPIL